PLGVVLGIRRKEEECEPTGRVPAGVALDHLAVLEVDADPPAEPGALHVVPPLVMIAATAVVLDEEDALELRELHLAGLLGLPVGEVERRLVGEEVRAPASAQPAIKVMDNEFTPHSENAIPGFPRRI